MVENRLAVACKHAAYSTCHRHVIVQLLIVYLHLVLRVRYGNCGINLVQGLSCSELVFSVSLAETGFHCYVRALSF